MVPKLNAALGSICLRAGVFGSCAVDSIGMRLSFLYPLVCYWSDLSLIRAMQTQRIPVLAL
jgi:hypothetical protein